MSALVQMMAWCRVGDKPLLEPVLVNILAHMKNEENHCVFLAAKERLGWLLGHPEFRFICEKQEVLEAVALSEDAGYSTQMMHMYNGVDKSKRYRAKWVSLSLFLSSWYPAMTGDQDIDIIISSQRPLNLVLKSWSYVYILCVGVGDRPVSRTITKEDVVLSR